MGSMFLFFESEAGIKLGFWAVFFNAIASQ